MTKYVKVAEAADKISKELNIPLANLADIFAEIPRADVKEVKHGEWVHGECVSHCSECGVETHPENITPYCPNCGAKMNGGGEE